MFPKVLAGEIVAGAVQAMRFDLIDEQSRRVEGPALGPSDAKSRSRIVLRYNDKDDSASVILMGPGPGGMLALLIDRGRPHVVVFPHRRGRPGDRHGVAFVPAGKLPPPRGA